MTRVSVDHGHRKDFFCRANRGEISLYQLETTSSIFLLKISLQNIK